MAVVSYRVKLYNAYDSYGRDRGEYLCDLTELTSQKLTLTNGDIDVFDFTMSTQAANAGLCEGLKTFVRVWRDVEGRAARPDATPNFCGYVTAPVRSAKSQTMTFRALSPLWRLQLRQHIDHHNLRDPDVPGASQNTNPLGPFKKAEIMWKLITFTAQIQAGSWGSDFMGLRLGDLYTGGDPYPVSYERGQVTWDAIAEMSKGTMTIELGYVNDVSAPSVLADFNTRNPRGVQRDSVHWRYISDTADPNFPGNLDDLTEREITDPEAIANYVTVQGQGDAKGDRSIEVADGSSRSGGGITWAPPDTRDDYGIYQLWRKDEHLPGGPGGEDERSELAQQVLRRTMRPPRLVEASFPSGADCGFTFEWDIGDGVRISCNEGAFDFTDRWLRVAAVNLSLDEFGNEQCIPLLTDDYSTLVTPDGYTGG